MVLVKLREERRGEKKDKTNSSAPALCFDLENLFTLPSGNAK
jgi:hypothetical protein